MNRVTKLAFALVLGLVGLSGLAQAQDVTTASLNGLVVDETGEGLPGATVLAVHLPSGTRYGNVTRGDGRYNLTGLRVGGPYAVTVTFVGYRPEERRLDGLTLGQDLELNVRLREEGVAGEEVVVEVDRSAVISSDRTGASTNISQEQIQRLPTLTRSLGDLTRLSPQAATNGFNNTIAGRNNLYNNITIDGSVFNNVFGLAGEVGGQTNAQPISLDAIEQVQINIAPFDVRQGQFTGAGINVVTRSGTNRIEGTAYTLNRSETFVGEKVDTATVPLPAFTQNRYGVSLGGPIVQNRAFLFVNAELARRDDPGQFFRPRLASDPAGATGVSSVAEADLQALTDLLASKYNFDPGTFGSYTLDTYSDNVTARFDLNLSQAHRFSLRYNYLNSYRDVPLSNSGATGGRQNNAQRVPFSGSNYRINNDVQSFIGQLNSTFGQRYANIARLGFTALRDSRSQFIDRPFPLVDIENGAGQTITSFGAEPFTPNNRLDTDVFQFSNDFTAFLGAHTVTLGTSNEFYSFANGFTPNYYGVFRFRSLADFVAHVNAADPTAAGVPQPSRYQLQYSAVPGVAVPLAEISAAQLGFYAQDEWSPTRTLRLTLGLRADVPVFTSDLPANPTVAALRFQDQDGNDERIDVSKLPDSTPLWSPRLGFNWDALGNRTLQLRGGTGIFTGKIPFVWVSNQASNNGVLFGETLVQAPAAQANNSAFRLCLPGTGTATVPCQQITFTDDVRAYVPATAAAPASVLINATDEDFRFPQVWRTSFAVDGRLPLGVIGTLEGMYSKDLNAVFHRNANLADPIGTFEGPDNRPRFGGTDATARINNGVPATATTAAVPAVTSAIVLDNTTKGYQSFVTGQLQKTFTAGPFDGLYTSFAYTNAMAKDLTSSTSSIAATAYNNNQVSTSPNDPVLGYSNYLQRHRVIGVAAYELEYLGLAGTSFSVVYSGGSGFRYSYTYANDMNGDRINGNDLIYIPTDANDPAQILVEKNGTSDPRTEADIRAQIEAYIEQDDYLSEHRGEYATRGGAEAPWTHRVDLGIKQRFFVPMGGRRTRVELSFDIQNVANLLNSEWGLQRTTNVGATQFLSFRSVAPALVNGQPNPNANRPIFTMPLVNGQPLAESFRVDTDLGSRWQAQFGLRVSF